MRLNLGSGNTHIAGFISVDLYDAEAEVRADITELPYSDESVDEIICLQVIEHIHYAKSDDIFKEMHRVLKPGGMATVETVDFDYICRSVLRDGLTKQWQDNIYGGYWRPQDTERYSDWFHHEGSVHRNAWNLDRLQHYADKYGFTLVQNQMEDKHPLYKYKENLSVRLTKN